MTSTVAAAAKRKASVFSKNGSGVVASLLSAPKSHSQALVGGGGGDGLAVPKATRRLQHSAPRC